MKTLQQLVADTRETLGDKAGSEFTEGAIVAAVNQALQEAAKAGFLRRIYLYTLPANVHTIDLATAATFEGFPLKRINGVKSVVYLRLMGV